jgi:hypothetical protein
VSSSVLNRSSASDVRSRSGIVFTANTGTVRSTSRTAPRTAGASDAGSAAAAPAPRATSHPLYPLHSHALAGACSAGR